MSGVGLRQSAPLAFIKLARRVFANTPVQRLPLVSWVYRRTVGLAWGGAEVTADFRGVTLSVPGGDAWLPAALVGGFYEAIELDLLELLAARSRTVLDVGANIGIHTCVAAARMPAGGRLVAFEPSPANLECLRRNIARNGLDGVVRVEASAVGESAGELLLHLDADSGGNNSLAAGMVPNSRGTVPVPVTSVDGYLEEHLASAGSVDVLKVDVEGFDGYVLRGAGRLLREHRPALLVEFVPGHLVRAGYSVGEFLDQVFAVYPDVWLVNEPRREMSQCTRAALAAYESGTVNLNLNLVAVARAEHRELVADFAATISAAASARQLT